MELTYKQEKMIESAISFLVKSINTSGHNTKPVIIHSIRVAMYLYEKNQSVDVIIAALLHDVVEDTKIPIDEIRSKFGDKVANLVFANTFKSEIEDYEQRYSETFQRTIKAGFEATLIKAADLLDNSYYYQKGSPDTWARLYNKFSKFTEISESVIGENIVWRDLKSRLTDLKKELDLK